MNNIMEKLKNYQKPTMRVVRLQQRSLLLEGSPEPYEGSQSRELRRAWKDED